ncbi:fibronectin-III type domain-containing protein [Phthorimaea operculella]|nr:fibronectin-III type domain-containing protein [Phthorimaea operculella]
MSAVSDETLTEKPLLNGDTKEIVEEVNGKIESNGTGDGENVQNKENILSNGDEIDNHKGTENIISDEKPSGEPSLVDKSDEIENFIAANKPLECSSAEEINESKEDLNVEDLLEDWSPAAETEETESVTPETEPVEETLQSEVIKEVAIESADVISADEPVTEKNPAEESNVGVGKDLTPVKESADERLPAKETKESEDLSTAKKSEDVSLSESELRENLLPTEEPANESLPVEKAKEASDLSSSEKPVNESASVPEAKESENDRSKENSSIDFTSEEEKALAEQELTKPDVTEEEQIVMGTAEQKESDVLQSQDEEMPELEESTEKPVEPIPETILDTQSEKPVPIGNGTHQNAEDDTEKVVLTNSALDKSESMEVDENDIKTLKSDLESNSEHDVTQSISDMVDNIVQNLNDDAADDLMDDIEMDSNEKVESTGPAAISNNLTNKTEIENTDGVCKDESEKQSETASIPTTSNLVEEEHTKMEVDQEPSVNTMDGNLGDNIVTIENKETSLPDDTSKTSEEPLVATKEDVTPQKPVDATSSTLSEVDDAEKNKNCEASQNSINENEPKSSDNNIVEINSDKTITVIPDSTLKENENKEMGTDDSEVIELKSDSSANSSFAKVEDDTISLITNGSEKDQDTTNKETLETPDKDVQVAGETVLDDKNDASDTEKRKINEDIKQISEQKNENEKTPEKVPMKSHTPLIKLSNTMDILSDDEDEPSTEAPKTDPEKKLTEAVEKQQTINLIDDDDIMLIDEDPKEDKAKSPAEPSLEKHDESESKTEDEPSVAKSTENETSETPADVTKDPTTDKTEAKDVTDGDVAADVQPEADKPLETVPEKPEKSKPIIPPDFFKTYRKNLADMTRDDLEEFCILKIVESIIDRSNLNEIRTKLKTMALNIEEYKKKAMMLTKQNRDLQVVLKSVQEEQKKSTGKQPITPLKITRSVGMQVLMTDKSRRRVMPGPGTGPNASNNNQANNRNVRTPNQSPRNTPQKATNQIPVPRLVPAGMNVGKPVPVAQANIAPKPVAVQNGTKNTPPAQKPEKRTHSRMQSQSSSSVTVDLTDDEPPPKVATKSSPAPPVRLVNQQNLLAPRQQFAQQVNSPRKVYIPISLNGPQAQTTRPGQTIMLKTVGQGPRPRGPNTNTTVVRTPQSAVQVRKIMGTRHPAPLPDAMKQYQPPNWKALPPAPDLKLSKVENGIVISWKIEGYQEDSYEEIASYQLYAYQETSAPASTSLWKKIGDVKALPLPMACTLTQFMAGYKYYFAVRAVDIRSRLGPFSLPGSILLLNKM